MNNHLLTQRRDALKSFASRDKRVTVVGFGLVTFTGKDTAEIVLHTSLNGVVDLSDNTKLMVRFQPDSAVIVGSAMRAN
jgi:hypothetical protein